MSSEITKLLGRNSLATIPTDQQKLLDRHGIGAIHPGSNASGLPVSEDVPRHVISSVADAYIERRKRNASMAKFTGHGRPAKASKVDNPRPTTGDVAEEDYVQGSRRKSSLPVEKRTSPSSTGRQVHHGVENKDTRSTPQPQPQGTAADSSPERELSWSPSPSPPPNRTYSKRQGAEAVQKPQPQGSPDLALQENMAPPQRPRAAPRLAPDYDFPSSSGPEEDLEMELPLAYGQSQPPPISNISIPQSSNKTPNIRKQLAMDTPPCAQPSQTVIPGTAVRNPSPQAEEVTEHPKSRRMKPIQFSDPTNASPSAPPANASTSFQRMASTKKYLDISSSNGTSSSSIIPASVHTGNSQEATQPMHTQPEYLSPVRPPEELHNDGTQMSLAEVEATQQPPASIEIDAASPQDLMKVTPTRSIPMSFDHPETEIMQSVEPENKPDRDIISFGQFASIYPDYVEKYSGGLKLFVRACICLEHMSKAKTLNHYLWDDFIRSFSAEFLTYALNARDPLPASEWYNDRDQKPLYKYEVVQKSNLQSILSHHKDEVAEEKRHLSTRGRSRNRGSTVSSTDRQDPKTPASHTSSRSYDLKDSGKRGRQSINSTPAQPMGPPPPRAVSYPTPRGESDRLQMRPASGNVGAASPPAVDPKRHTSLGAVPHPHLTSTPAIPDSSQMPRAPSSSRRSTMSTKSGLGAYMKSLSKPRSTKERDKIRQHIKRPSTGISSDSKD